MRRKKREVESEARIVFGFSEPNSWRVNTYGISDLVTAMTGVGQALKC